MNQINNSAETNYHDVHANSSHVEVRLKLTSRSRNATKRMLKYLQSC